MDVNERVEELIKEYSCEVRDLIKKEACNKG